MSLSIHTSYASLVTQNSLNAANKASATASQRLGTGLRVNSAADDAAGLQIATRLKAQSNGMATAMRNAQDASSMLQTAEGAFDEMTNITQRMKDLSTQAANGTNSDADIKAMNTEFQALQKEMTSIMENTAFGGQKLFASGGAAGGALGTTAGISFQIGNDKAEVLEVKIGTGVKDIFTTLSGGAGGVGGASGLTAANATNMMDATVKLLDQIGSVRSELGANINRLDHTVNNLANMKENTDVATGRIMDADIAKESVNASKQELLMQSGMAILAKTKQQTSMVANLLQ